jgi:uncharacterized protein YndB with AHSA1/START domain
MANKSETISATADRELVTSRLLNAPRELVFKVWTDPNHVGLWWGPNGFTNTIHKMDVRPGGEWNFIMHGPDGTDYPNKIVFKKVEKPSLLEFTHGTGIENDPQEFYTVVTFTEEGDKTRVIMTAILPSKEEKDRVVKEIGAIEGGKQTFDRLEQYLLNMNV